MEVVVETAPLISSREVSQEEDQKRKRRGKGGGRGGGDVRREEEEVGEEKDKDNADLTANMMKMPTSAMIWFCMFGLQLARVTGCAAQYARGWDERIRRQRVIKSRSAHCV